MKKYIVVVGVALFLAVLGYYLVWNTDFYLFKKDESLITAIFTVKNNQLLVIKDGVEKELMIKGFDLDSAIPGYNPTDFAIDEATYTRWFGMIQESGANAIRVYTIMQDTFYNAFAAYNKTRDEPLYLLQTLWVTDYANDSSEDAFDDKFRGQLIKDVRDAVDIIHGRKELPINSVRGSGVYKQDISQWVIGYMVGNGWNPKTVAFTDHMRDDIKGYNGKYFSTDIDASPFESLMAEIMDEAATYESQKYAQQRLYCFYNDPTLDPFEYLPEVADQIEKYAFIDPESIVVSEDLRGGYFAAYKIIDHCPNFSRYLSEEQLVKLGAKTDSLESGFTHYGYVELLNRYHTIPVVITGYAHSTARGALDKAPITERQQGQALVSDYNSFTNSGSKGVFITSWQDVWSNRSNTTMHKVNIIRSSEWSDYQTPGQFYGVLSFDPGYRKPFCHVDGDILEWHEADSLIVNGDMSLYVNQDEKFLYLLLKDKQWDFNKKYYIPIDITPKSGSNYYPDDKIKFERQADFILSIDGYYGTRMLTHERYDVLREYSLYDINGTDPFVRVPNIDVPTFNRIETILNKIQILNKSELRLNKKPALKLYETGKLLHGNSNPDSIKYNSLSDFCVFEGGVEIRIPWQMLNFSLPSRGFIHDDYYENYGIDDLAINRIFLGVGNSDSGSDAKRIPMNQWELTKWDNKPTYHERLKPAYDMIKKCWAA